MVNYLYEEFDKLITKAQLDYFLDELWRMYPRVYKSIHARASGKAYAMLELLMERHPKVFNSLMTRTLKR